MKDKLLSYPSDTIIVLLLTLCACARVTVVILCVSVCVSVTALPPTYLFYMLKTRCH